MKRYMKVFTLDGLLELFGKGVVYRRYKRTMILVAELANLYAPTLMAIVSAAALISTAANCIA